MEGAVMTHVEHGSTGMKRSSILVVCGTLALAVLLVWLGVGSSHDRARAVRTAVDVEAGVPLHLHARGASTWAGEIARAHCVFLLRDEQATDVTGPYADGDPASNHRIGGIELWLRDPSLLSQLVGFDPNGNAELRALAPGRYTLRAFPGDLVFEPEWIDVPAPSAPVEIRWSPR
jgi:hypothetical protein